VSSMAANVSGAPNYQNGQVSLLELSLMIIEEANLHTSGRRRLVDPPIRTASPAC